jgi:outer membrane receptor protein involved in Fe transport
MKRSFKRLLATTAFLMAVTPQMAMAQTTPDPETADDAATAPNDAAATADEVATPLETGDGNNELVVTGSRIARPEFSFPNPITSFTSESLQQSGDTDITDFLTDTAALQGSLTGELNAGSNGFFQSAGLNLLNLRNLGTDRTLVLVNGRRHVNAYPGESSVDINTIPVSLIERIDIVTGGASAVYGADGVSGVVNFVLRRDFEGVEVRGQSGISERGDAGRRFGSITAGRNFADGRGNLTLAYEFNESDRLSQRARPYTGDPARRFELLRQGQRGSPDRPDILTVPDRVLFNNVGWQDSSTNGAIDIDLDGIPDFEGDGSVYDRGTVLPGTGGRAVNSASNTPTAGYFGDFLPYLRRHNVNVLGSFEVSPALRFFAEGKYVDTTAFTEAQPSFDFFTYLAPDNAFLQQRFGNRAPDGALLSRDNFDLGISNDFAERETLRGVFGIDGRLNEGEGSGNFRYELSYVYGRASSTVTGGNNRVTDRYFAALDAVVNPANGQITCRINLPGQTTIDENNYAGIAEINGVAVTGAPLTFRPGECAPLNLLGEGVLSQAAREFVSVDNITRARSTQHVLSGSFSGDFGALFSLPGGPAAFALGAEYREESTRSTPSEFQQGGFFDGGAAILPSGGKFNVKEVFAELNIPLLADVPFAETLSVGGAVRYSDYSTVGGTTTWKLDGIYAPVRDISFRGTYAQAVRAPNITELFSPLQGTFQFLDDPCDPTNVGEGSSFRAANCLATLQALGLTPQEIADFSPATDAEQSTSQPGLVGGNPNLREETARTWTAGGVLRPRFIPGLTVSADWYNIKLRNAINRPSANEILGLCVDQPTLDNQFCENVGRDPETGFVNRYLSNFQNVANFNTAGLDVVINYRFTPFDNLGTFNFKLTGGYLDTLKFISSVGAEPDEDAGEVGAARYVATTDLTWTSGPFTVNYGLSYFSKQRRFTTEQLRANPDLSDPRFFRFKERWEHDIQVAVRVNDAFSFYGGVNNFTDQQPSVAALSGTPVSPVGRFFYFGIRSRLDGLMGGLF